MITVLHNSICSKSNKAIEYLNKLGLDYRIRNYVEEPLSEEEIEKLLDELELGINEIIRKNEPLWIEKFSEKQYSNSGLISILANNPTLLQRPIVIHKHKAVIARPVEKIDLIL